MKPTTYTVTDFRQTMSPNLYKEGVGRLEHFDLTNGQARQYGAPLLSTSVAYGADIEANELTAFAKLSTILYAVGYDSSTNHPALFKWNSNNQNWEGLATSASGASMSGLVAYKGDLYGLYNGTNIFKCTTGGTLTINHAVLTYTNFSLPIVHKKDNLIYFFTDNIVTSFDGTTPTTALTLPTNFRITSACEDGDYILIVGTDTDGVGTAYLWDRDSVLTIITGKMDLGRDVPFLVAHLGGTSFILSKREDSTNSAVDDRNAIVIRYRNGDLANILAEYETLTLGVNFAIGGFYHDVAYFPAYVKLKGDTVAKNVVFALDHLGNLSVALNMSVNTAISNHMKGIFRDGDGFWIAGTGDGSWHITNTYTTASVFETTIMRNENIALNQSLRGAIVTSEPLPNGANIAVQARINEQSTWTTLKTFTTANSMKHAVNLAEGLTALVGLDRAKQITFRVTCAGVAASPVTLTGFQVILDPVKDENHG